MCSDGLPKHAHRYEGRIVQRLIQADGGKGDYTVRTYHPTERFPPPSTASPSAPVTEPHYLPASLTSEIHQSPLHGCSPPPPAPFFPPQESTPPMLGIWNTLLAGGTAKSTWVFMGWEGVEAQRKGVELNAFAPEDFGIPYGPSPLLITKHETLNGARASCVSCGPEEEWEGERRGVGVAGLWQSLYFSRFPSVSVDGA